MEDVKDTDEENKDGFEILDYFECDQIVFDKVKNTNDWYMIGT